MSEETVGYGKPPRKHRFKPGKSGNPSGRPKKPVCLMDAYRNVLAEEITANINGKKVRMTGAEVIARAMLKAAASGNTGAARELARAEPKEAVSKGKEPKNWWEQPGVPPPGPDGFIPVNMTIGIPGDRMGSEYYKDEAEEPEQNIATMSDGSQVRIVLDTSATRPGTDLEDSD